MTKKALLNAWRQQTEYVMSLMNCTFTVRWSDENEPHAALTERWVLSKNGCWSTAFGGMNMVVWKTRINRLGQKGFWWGGE